MNISEEKLKIALGNLWAFLIDCYFQIQLTRFSNYEVELENDFFKSREICIEGIKKCADTNSETGLAKCKAHRCLLARASPVWSSMLSKEDNREILKLTDLDIKVFRKILIFIYDGEITGETLKIHTKSFLNAARKVT
jgi:hypothetical protein